MGEEVNADLLKILKRGWKNKGERLKFTEEYPTLYTAMEVGFPKTMDEKTMEEFEEAAAKTKSVHRVERIAAAYVFIELLDKEALTKEKRDEAVQYFLTAAKDKDKYVRKYARSFLRELIQEGMLTEDEKTQALKLTGSPY